jgi:hypothetical protein
MRPPCARKAPRRATDAAHATQLRLKLYNAPTPHAAVCLLGEPHLHLKVPTTPRARVLTPKRHPGTSLSSVWVHVGGGEPTGVLDHL